MKKLWLDDLRDPADFVSPTWKQDGWVWAKSFEEAIAYLVHGEISYASLDNDLGGVKEGRHLVTWMVENGVWPKDGVAVHSANPVASKVMREDIERWGP